MILAWTIKSKNSKKNWWQTFTNVLSACQVSYGNGIPQSHGKKWNFGPLIFVFFCHDFHECHSHMKLGKHSKHWSKFATKLFLEFLDFTIHAKIIWAKTKMGTGQHFFHECKWHAHIGDAFLNILISYLNFSELVWIFYEVFKVMVKRSKGKSIRGAKWLGQKRWLLEIRGKTAEWDTTRGINLIIPLLLVAINSPSRPRWDGWLISW